MLDIQHLTIEFATRTERVCAVNDVSLSIGAGEMLGLVGESGSGKTTLGLAVTRLLPEPPAIIRQGAVHFQGRDLLQQPLRTLHRVRGGDIAYVFQEPATSLNPVLTVGRQLVEMLELHTAQRGRAAQQAAMGLLQRVGIPAAEARLRSYPHELSGGTKQRIMIAMAIASQPRLLIADEPTTALDVTLERQIVALLKQLQRDFSLSMLVISHNIHLIRQLADRLAVMWQGQIVEVGPAQRVLQQPQHDYTKHLLAAQPRVAGLAGGA